jgi:hypothetical protein
MHYLDYSDLSSNTSLQKRIVIRPHQIKKLHESNIRYKPPKIDCPSQEIDCYCSGVSNFFQDLIDSSGTTPLLLWLDPCSLTNESLAYFIFNWKQQITATQKVAIAIIVPRGNTIQKPETEYELWRMDTSGPLYGIQLENPTWYPSLERNRESLEKSADQLDPYDIFPLVEFPTIVTQSGEFSLTNHAFMLEKFRTRTRNFIYLDIFSPCQAFNQLCGTIGALPKFGASIIQPVITPGGNTNGYLTALLSGVIAESSFFTPKEEIPMPSNNEIQGIIILEKCI